MRQLLLLLTTSLTALACADAIPAPDGDGGAAPPPPVGGDPGQMGAPRPGELPAPGDPAAEFCEGTGPILEHPDSHEVIRPTCAGDVAEIVFANALCTCEDAQLAGYLRTRGFDSRDGALGDDDDPGSGGAPVGINGDYLPSAGFTDVGGSMAVTGLAGLTFIGYLKVAGDLRLAADALVPGYTQVGRDAWLAGDFAGGPLSVARDLRYSGEIFALPLAVTGQTNAERVALDPPCPCGDILDVPGLIGNTRRDNDNALVGLDPGELRQVVGSVSRTLPCGRYYVDEISGIGEIEVVITGRVVLAVGGPVAAAGNLQFRLEGDAELDLFIAGDLGLVGNARFGDPARPAASRIYVAGASDIALVGASDFVGNLYAPNATVTAPGYLRAHGSIFARSLQVPGYVNIAYDRAITDLDCGDEQPRPDGGGMPPDDGELPPPEDRFDEPPPADGAVCDLCGSCPDGLACIGSRCSPCETDRDCCGQQVCDAGRCGNLQ